MDSHVEEKFLHECAWQCPSKEEEATDRSCVMGFNRLLQRRIFTTRAELGIWPYRCQAFSAVTMPVVLMMMVVSAARSHEIGESAEVATKQPDQVDLIHLPTRI
jgi:hypothetical protein